MYMYSVVFEVLFVINHTKLCSSENVSLSIILYCCYFTRRHVQTNNEEALQFYKKFDFFITETKEGYYKTVEPAEAFVLQKTLKEPTYILD